MLASKASFHLSEIKKFSFHTLCLLNSSYNFLYHKPPFFFRKAEGKKIHLGHNLNLNEYEITRRKDDHS